MSAFFPARDKTCGILHDWRPAKHNNQWWYSHICECLACMCEKPTIQCSLTAVLLSGGGQIVSSSALVADGSSSGLEKDLIAAPRARRIDRACSRNLRLSYRDTASVRKRKRCQLECINIVLFIIHDLHASIRPLLRNNGSKMQHLHWVLVKFSYHQITLWDIYPVFKCYKEDWFFFYGIAITSKIQGLNSSTKVDTFSRCGITSCSSPNTSAVLL